MNEKAKTALTELLSLPEAQLNALFENHVEGDFGKLLEYAGYFKIPIIGEIKDGRVNWFDSSKRKTKKRVTKKRKLNKKTKTEG